VYTIRFYDENDPDHNTLLHETRCPLGSPLPRVGDTVEFNGLLYDVMGMAFVYGTAGEGPLVIIRVDDF
jgi:hypothetical protein